MEAAVVAFGGDDTLVACGAVVTMGGAEAVSGNAEPDAGGATIGALATEGPVVGNAAACATLGVVSGCFEFVDVSSGCDCARGHNKMTATKAIAKKQAMVSPGHQRRSRAYRTR